MSQEPRYYPRCPECGAGHDCLTAVIKTLTYHDVSDVSEDTARIAVYASKRETEFLNISCSSCKMIWHDKKAFAEDCKGKEPPRNLSGKGRHCE